MSSNPNSDTRQVLVYLPRDVHRALKDEAVRRKITMGDIVGEALLTRLHYLQHYYELEQQSIAKAQGKSAR